MQEDKIVATIVEMTAELAALRDARRELKMLSNSSADDATRAESSAKGMRSKINRNPNARFAPSLAAVASKEEHAQNLWTDAAMYWARAEELDERIERLEKQVEMHRRAVITEFAQGVQDQYPMWQVIPSYSGIAFRKEGGRHSYIEVTANLREKGSFREQEPNVSWSGTHDSPEEAREYGKMLIAAADTIALAEAQGLVVEF